MPDACQLCGEDRYQPLMRVEPANFSSRITAYDIRRCAHCELATMAPFPTEHDVQELYVRQNVFSQPPDNPNRRNLFFPLLEPLYKRYGADVRYIASTCLKLAGHARTVLDIGCSTGSQMRGFLSLRPTLHVSGIDIDPGARERADASVREHIRIGDFATHPPAQTFDIVTLKFVLEHMLDMRPYLENITRALRPGGLFFMATPDIDSPKARQLGAAWPLIDTPHQRIGHLRWFNKTSVRHLARAYGFTILKMASRGELLYHLPLRVQRLLVQWLGRDRSGRRFIRAYAPRMVYTVLFDALLSERVGYGDCVYTFMRKDR